MEVKCIRDEYGDLDKNYIIAIDGSYIRDKRTGEKLNKIYIKGNYRHINIKLNDNFNNTYKICHLQWLTWHGPIPNKHIIHHIDENKLNDHKDNLECITKAEHAAIHHKGKIRSAETIAKLKKAKTGKNHPMYGLIGDKCPNAKLHRNDVLKIKHMRYILNFSQNKIANELNVSRSCIRGILDGNSWNEKSFTKEQIKRNFLKGGY